VTVETFRMEMEPSAGTLEVRLFGAFDLAGFEQLDPLLEEAQANGQPDLRIDLRGLTFIDPSGLRARLGAQRRAEERSGSVVITPGSAAIQRVIELAGVTESLVFEDQLTSNQPDG
jgi:anti-sigma B factor antagonist